MARKSNYMNFPSEIFRKSIAQKKPTRNLTLSAGMQLVQGNDFPNIATQLFVNGNISI